MSDFSFPEQFLRDIVDKANDLTPDEEGNIKIPVKFKDQEFDIELHEGSLHPDAVANAIKEKLDEMGKTQEDIGDDEPSLGREKVLSQLGATDAITIAISLPGGHKDGNK